MASSDVALSNRDRRKDEARSPAPGPLAGLARLRRALGRLMPKRLYARSLIIVIAPMLLLQSVIAFVFMERHWQTVTRRLSSAVTRDISAIIDLIETYPDNDGYGEIVRIAQERMELNIDILPPDCAKPSLDISSKSMTLARHQASQRFMLSGVSSGRLRGSPPVGWFHCPTMPSRVVISAAAAAACGWCAGATSSSPSRRPSLSRGS